MAKKAEFTQEQIDALPKTRAEGFATGSVHYRGKKCKHGHDNVRTTKTGVCLTCQRAFSKRSHSQWLEKPENLERSRAKARDYHAEHREEILAAKPWRARSARYRANRNARAMDRYARLTQSTPVWLSKEEKSEMLRFYKIAQIMTDVTMAPYEVDHIVPLRGRTVCGLHTPWNLRVVTAFENNSRLKIWDPNQEAA